MQKQEQEASTSANDLAPHVQEIARALGDKLTNDEIAAELAKYLDYGVPLAQAKRDMIRNYGGTPGAKKVNEVTTGDSSVDLLVKVVTVNEKQVTARGEQKTIRFGLLGDETGTIPYTAWKDFGFGKGDVVAIKNAYVTEWREQPQVNLGDRCAIEAADAEITLPPMPAREPTERKIGELRGGIGNVIVTGRVTRIETKEIGEDKRTIFAGELADETGKVRFTAWHDHALARDGVYRIAGAYVKAWKGMPDLNFDERATITALKPDALPPAAELATATIAIGDLERIGGGTDVQVQGTLLEVRPGSGLILRCPECNRVVQKRECRLHGKVEGIADLRIKAVLDDGTAALTCYIGREVTETLIGIPMEKCQALAKEAMSQDVVLDEIASKVAHRPLRVRGNATSDEFGLILIATRAEVATANDPKAEAERLLEELEEVA